MSVLEEMLRRSQEDHGPHPNGVCSDRTLRTWSTFSVVRDHAPASYSGEDVTLSRMPTVAGLPFLLVRSRT